jgi:hypothetical protein
MKSTVDKPERASGKPIVRDLRKASSLPTPASAPVATSLANNRGSRKVRSLHNKGVTRPILPPTQPEPAAAPQPSFLARAFGWLGAGTTNRRQLQVVDTVQLGEKRFVTILLAEGRKFLIGGGPQGVSLLTALEDQLKSSDRLKILAEMAEPAE